MHVSVRGASAEPRAGRLRVLLAALALSAGRPVSNSRLATAVWGDDPPYYPRRSLHTYVNRLRGVLGDQLIGTRPDGYALETAPERVDVLQFGHLLDGLDAVDDMHERRRRLDAALALWQGDPFQDLRSMWLESVVAPGLTERRLAAIEARVDLDLVQGRDAGLAQLWELSALHPLRESLWSRLLVLLSRAGRPGEALAQYEIIRARLADELGTDPASDLRAVHAGLLAGTVPWPVEPDGGQAVPAGRVHHEADRGDAAGWPAPRHRPDGVS